MADKSGLSKEQRDALSRGRTSSLGGGLNDVLVPKKKQVTSQTSGPDAKQREVKSDPPKKEKYDRVIHYDPGTRPAPQRAETDGYTDKNKGTSGNERAVKRSGNGVKNNTEEKESLLVRFVRGLIVEPAPYPECQYFKGRGRFDIPLFIVILVLAVFGLVMMSSASYAYSLFENRDSYDFMKQQLEGMIIGLILMVIVSFGDYTMLIMPIKHILRHSGDVIREFFGMKKKKRTVPKNGKGINIAHIFFLISIVLMAITCVAGEEVADARRWITILGVRFQPSEIMKLALIIMLAFLLHRFCVDGKSVKGSFGRYVLVLGMCGALCAFQRHISAVVIVFVIFVVMMVVGGASKRGLFILGILVLLAFVGILLFHPSYLTDRFQGWFDPFADMQNNTYQIGQSLITIGSGGLFGRGLGNSIQKYYYLPEAQNDFVFSILCEELGFIGGVTVILLFVLFAVRGYKVAKGARDQFGAFLALGITVHIVLQAFLNIGVACNAIPNTGISLPFFSYGRTALIIQLVEMGVLLSVSRSSET